MFRNHASAFAIVWSSAWGVYACTNEISTSDYSTSCEADDQCAHVFEGACSECGYPHKLAAINVVDIDRYRRDFGDLGCKGDSDLICDYFDPPFEAFCDAGVCSAVPVIGCEYQPLAECEGQIGCRAVFGKRFADNSACLAESAVVACVAGPFCNDASMNVRDPEDRCWQIDTDCVPGNWRYTGSGECPEQFATDGC